MLLGLLERTLRETWRTIAWTCLGLALVIALFVRILPSFQEGLTGLVAQVPFLHTMISGLVGVDIGDGLSVQTFLSVVWSHPVVLAILWGFELAFASRVPAGEVDRGTVDVLLGWPVSRPAVLAAETLVWLVAGLLLLASGLLSFLASARLLPVDQRPDAQHLLLVLANLYAVYLVVGATAFLASTASSQRGRAVAVALVFVLASYLLNFLAQTWPAAERIAFLSFMHYYVPARIFLSGDLSPTHLIVLTGAAAVLWILSLRVWSRRDVLTT